VESAATEEGAFQLALCLACWLYLTQIVLCWKEISQLGPFAIHLLRNEGKRAVNQFLILETALLCLYQLILGLIDKWKCELIQMFMPHGLRYLREYVLYAQRKAWWIWITKGICWLMPQLNLEAQYLRNDQSLRSLKHVSSMGIWSYFYSLAQSEMIDSKTTWLHCILSALKSKVCFKASHWALQSLKASTWYVWIFFHLVDKERNSNSNLYEFEVCQRTSS